MREYSPCWISKESGITVGLLTDSGHRDRWTRIIPRDGKPAKPAPHEVPDVNLYYVCGKGDDQNELHFFVKQTSVKRGHEMEQIERSQPYRVAAFCGLAKARRLESARTRWNRKLFNPWSDVRAIIPFPVEAAEINRCAAQESFPAGVRCKCGMLTNS